ncbi:DNA (cytosine-5)-methyltransferase 1 [Homoserinimonas aerilata]|uniref:DNA (cytosine-5-)-methyltransferase n=1 Tax=Homoserinimonas aerilata TaxID=1162970 RepID=A0A542YF30_9MICO|nr:DNA cytosine methyltransferase [Homoserinimonas aerilata]TQL46693.1 DNA (cytosine-5)-methyltransferase 1 [Homoserinimonas aerilata]
MITVTDLFCGAGGSSSGLATLPGVRVVMAANHWKLAIDSHQANHPDTDHSNADISQVEPSWFPTTDILWASPECTNHSVAKGVKRQRALNEALFDLDGTRPLPDEAANRSRATMWDVPRFAEYHHYKAIIIENVVDAAKWIPFPAWLQTMELLGYEHEIVWLNSMHAQARGLPAPQSRDRMYVVFWLKGNRKPDLQKWTRPQAFCERHGVISAMQVFKKKEHWGRYRAQYVYKCPQCAAVVEPAWLPASSAIDWSIAGTRIGDREKPLSPKTMTRIQKGIEKYWKPITLAAAGNTYDGVTTGSGYLRAWPVDEALPTQTTTAQHGVALPPLITDGIRGEGTVQSGANPMLTQTTAQTKGFLAPPLVVRGEGNEVPAKPVGDSFGAFTAAGSQFLVVPVEGREGKTAASGSDPLRTQSTRNETAIVVPLRNNGVAKSADRPIDTVSANGNHHGLLMRNNTGGSEMTTPVTEVMRTLTTGGHQSLLVPYYGNGNAGPVSDPHRALTTVDRYSLVTGPVDVEDCEFRMLTPDEIKVGMAFAREYILLGTKREQVKQSGNAVTPPAARDLGAAVIESLGIEIERAA